MSEKNTEFNLALDIITNDTIFGDRTKSELELLKNFEWSTGRLLKFWNSGETLEAFNSSIQSATDITQDDKWELEEMYPEMQLLRELRKFAGAIKKTSQS